MASVLDQHIKDITQAWARVTECKALFEAELTNTKNAAASEKKKWKALLDSLDKNLSGKALDLQKTKAEKIPDACDTVLEIIKAYRIKLNNYLPTMPVERITYRAVDQELLPLLAKLETEVKKLKQSPANESALTNIFKHSKNWSTTKKNETKALETTIEGNISLSVKAVKRSKELIDKYSKYVSSSVLEKFKMLKESLNQEEMKSMATKLMPLAQTLRDNTEKLEEDTKDAAELAALRVAAMDLNHVTGYLYRKVSELKG